MYSSFFGLRENPFNLTPDPRFLFLSPYHKEALEHLLSGIKERKGLITITGGIGTGKTTLSRTLLSHLDATTKSALIFNSFISDTELLKAISQEFDIDPGSSTQSKDVCLNALNHYLHESFGEGGNAVVLIDEAQNLPQAVLELLLTLSNIESEGDKLIQIVLVGQSELKELLAASSLTALNEQIAVRYHLKPLDSKDIRAYVGHRLGVAGGPGNLQFSTDSFKKIYAFSRGNPRRINALCDRALLIAYVKERYTITGRIVEKAVEELRGDTDTKPKERMRLLKRTISPVSLTLLFMVVASLAGWYFKGHILELFSGEKKTAPVKVSKIIDIQARPVEPEKQQILIIPMEQPKTPQEAPLESESLQLLPGEPQPQEKSSTETNSAWATESTPPKKMAFSVQVGAFLMKGNAEKLSAKLRELRYESYVTRISDYVGKTWYSVRIMDASDLEDALRAASAYKKKEGKPAIVTPIDSLEPVTVQNEQPGIG